MCYFYLNAKYVKVLATGAIQVQNNSFLAQFLYSICPPSIETRAVKRSFAPETADFCPIKLLLAPLLGRNFQTGNC